MTVVSVDAARTPILYAHVLGARATQRHHNNAQPGTLLSLDLRGTPRMSSDVTKRWSDRLPRCSRRLWHLQTSDELCSFRLKSRIWCTASFIATSGSVYMNIKYGTSIVVSSTVCLPVQDLFSKNAHFTNQAGHRHYFVFLCPSGFCSSWL